MAFYSSISGGSLCVSVLDVGVVCVGSGVGRFPDFAIDQAEAVWYQAFDPMALTLGSALAIRKICLDWQWLSAECFITCALAGRFLWYNAEPTIWELRTAY